MKRLILFLALLVAVIGVVYFGTLRSNVREVIPGEFYGSAQLSGAALARFVRERGIRTVISLRAAAPDEQWYRDELAKADELGLTHRSIGMYASSPHVDQVIELFERVQQAERPLLVHCRAGIDRTGLASILGLLGDERYALAAARAQANRGLDRWRSDTIGKQFLRQYEAWLAARGDYHAPRELERWLRHDYLDPTGNVHFLVHPIAGRTWYKPFGRFAEGARFPVSRAEHSMLSLDGWAFDAKRGTELAGMEVFIDGRAMQAVEYGIRSAWLLEDFGNPAILDTGWRASQPLHLLADGCHELSFRFTRLDGSHWDSPPAGRVCVE